MRERTHGSTHMPLRNGVLRLAAAAGLAATLILAGCSEDADEQALDQASIKLASVDVGVGSQMPPKETARQFREVISAMQPLASGDHAHAGDAAVLLAMAQRGLGLQAAAKVAEMDREARNELPKIRAHLRAWLKHSTAAEAEGAYDPAPEITQIDAEVRSRQQDIQRVEASKAEIQDRISGLMDQVQERVTRAAELRNEAGTLRLQMPNVSATEGLALSERIRTLSREADALEFEARELKNQADQLGLDERAANLEIEKFRTQVELLGQSRVAVEGRGTAAQRSAADARGYAQEAAESLADLIENSLVAKRAAIDAAAAEAVSQMQTAARSARSGTTARRNSAQLAIGQSQQGLGDAHWAHAMGLDAYASLMNELAAADPALPNASQYAQRAAEAREKATNAKRAAFEAYTAAVSAYESAGARGDAGDRMNEAMQRLRELAAVVGAGVVDADALSQLEDSAPDQDESAGASDPAPGSDVAASTDPEAELRAALDAAIQASDEGRYSDAARMLHPDTDADAPLVPLLTDLLAATEELDGATEAAFGQRFTRWAEENATGDSMGDMNPSIFANSAAEDWDIRVQGDEAIALTGDPAQPEIRFRRVEGEWKMLLNMDALGGAEVPEQFAASMAELMPEILNASTEAFREAAAGVESGALQSNQAVQVTIQTKMQAIGMKVMQKMMESGAMPGGGG